MLWLVSATTIQGNRRVADEQTLSKDSYLAVHVFVRGGISNISMDVLPVKELLAK
jgi:hypothetical protein